MLVLTVDGRTLTGTLTACDVQTNLVLTSTIERVIRPPPPPTSSPSSDSPEPEEENAIIEYGLYVVRGDHVVVCGLVDEALDASIDWMKVRGEVIGTTKHAA